MTQSASSNDVFIFSVSGTSTKNFTLSGGVYAVALAAVSWGTVTLNLLAADAVTYVPVQVWSANAGTTLTLVAGSYQLSYASLGVATLSVTQQPPSPDWRMVTLAQPTKNVQFLTASSGNYVVPASIYSLRGYMTGAGGGGGGVANANASAGGGTSGVYIEFFMAVTPGQIIAFTCGAKGTGGAAGNNNGTAGGDSTFGPFTTKGGAGSTGSASGNAAITTVTAQGVLLAGSKIAPTVTQAVLSVAFQAGMAGATGLGGFQGNGQGPPWGNPGAQVGPSAAGLDATGYGPMGSSATSTTGGSFKGGDGAPGAIMIVGS